MDLINKLADPVGLGVGDLVTGGLMVAVVGMTITFLALMFLWLAIAIMSKFLTEKPKPAVATPAAAPIAAQAVQPSGNDDSDEELVAVITAALAASMQTSIQNIVVSKIVRVPDQNPAWAKNGLIDQMNNRF